MKLWSNGRMESVIVSVWRWRSSSWFDYSELNDWHMHCSRTKTRIEKKNGKEVSIMKRIGSMVSVLVMVGSLGGSALAFDGVLSKQEFTPDSYCHMKFPAIRQRTLAGDNPVLKNSTTGDVIDFYGSCDESPTGKDQVAAQKLEEQHLYANSYAD
jgi:hypothetical protein